MPSPQDLEQTAKKARARGNYRAATAEFEELARQSEDPSEAYLEAALCAALAGDLAETARLFGQRFQTSKSPSFATFNDFLNLCRQTGQEEAIEAALDRLFPRKPGAEEQAGRSHQAMVFTLPKSAGTSVVQTLAATLRVGRVASGSDDARAPGYSASLLEPGLLQRLASEKLLHQTHAMPWRENLVQLRQHCFPKIVVHLRDPRDALLSYYYMAEKYELHRLRLLLMYPDYNRLDPPKRMQLLSRTVYFRFLEWITGWVAVADTLGEQQAMVTTFERFKGEPDAFFRDLSIFFSGKERPLARVRQTHFRRGNVGQTDDPLLPQSMRKSLYDYIPRELSRRFGWSA